MAKPDSAEILKELHEPKYIGPGVWYMLHLLALESESSPEIKEAFPQMIDVLRQKFPCEICRKHLNKAVRELPVRPHADLPHGYWTWAYAIHDKANKRLDKVSPDIHEARRWFINPGECENCGGKETQTFTGR